MSQVSNVLKAASFSIVTNVALVVVKWTAGHIGHSFALIADAIESSSDVLSSVLVLLGAWYASRPADKNHPYGHGRLEPLVTFVVVVFLVGSALVIAHESIQHIRTPHEMPKPFTLYVLGGIILWKELSFQWVLRQGKAAHSSVLIADAWHHRSDAITSVSAFVGISIALYFGEGYESADDWASLFASAFILYNSYHIFRPALGEIMDEHRYEGLVDEIRKQALHVKGVLNTEKCHVRKAGTKYYIDLHAIVNGSLTVSEGHEIAHRLKDHLMGQLPHVADVLVHIEPM
jgi:cation diffusion facilitator family transporter